jgi:hypothetical protein
MAEKRLDWILSGLLLVLFQIIPAFASAILAREVNPAEEVCYIGLSLLGFIVAGYFSFSPNLLTLSLQKF